MVTRERILIGIALVISCLTMAIGGSVYSFNSYYLAIKKTFGYTESQTELIGAFANFGFSVALPAGLMWDHYGGRMTSVVGLILTVTSYVLILSTTFNKTYYRGDKGAGLQSFYFFMAGLGACSSNMNAFLSCLNNFSANHRAKLTGVLDASLSAGSTLFSLFYGLFFAQGHQTDAQNQNLKGYYLMMIVVFFIVNVLGVVFLKIYLEPEAVTISASSSSTILLSDEGESGERKYYYGVIKDNFGSNPDVSSPDVTDDAVTGLKLLRQLDFHLLTWSFIGSTSIAMAIQANITTLLKSAYLEAYSTLLTTMGFAIITVAKLIVGAISDAAAGRIPRVAFLFGCAALQAAVMVVSVITVDNLAVLITITIGLAISSGIAWCLTPAIVAEMFGINNLGSTWGVLILGGSVTSILAQSLFGAVYDSAIDEVGVTDCYGNSCFRPTMVVYTVFSVVCCAFCALLLKRHFRDQRNKNLKVGEARRMVRQKGANVPATGGYSGDVSSNSE